MKQGFTSACTSINASKPPAIYSNKTATQIMRGKAVLDVGGGRFDTAIEKAKEYGAVVDIYDPYNRTEAHNKRALKRNHEVAVISNVLNVIDDHDARMETVRLALSHAPTVLITVYEGNGTGIGKQSGKDAWQENRKTISYETEIKDAFLSAKVTRKGKLIIVNGSPF